MSALRIFLWLLILGCLGWLLYFGVRLLRGGGKASSATNYSFKRD
jgi:TRAP-type C4-dicarboxylate transport system permease small subunit